jgi:hypothetical protein
MITSLRPLVVASRRSLRRRALVWLLGGCVAGASLGLPACGESDDLASLAAGAGQGGAAGASSGGAGVAGTAGRAGASVETAGAAGMMGGAAGQQAAGAAGQQAAGAAGMTGGAAGQQAAGAAGMTGGAAGQQAAGAAGMTGGAAGQQAAGAAGQAGVVYHAGDEIVLTGKFGAENVVHTFLGGVTGPIETLAEGAERTNEGAWKYSDPGGKTHIAIDQKRGKVLFNTEDNQTYNAVRRWDPGAPIVEHRHFYKAHYVRNVLTLGGVPWTKSYQWKHERINWVDSVVDSDCELKLHDWQGQGPLTFVNRSATDKSTYYGGSAPDHNGDWAMIEIIVSTGTQGVADGSFVTRIHKGGKTIVSQNKQPETIYASDTLRLRYFVEQNYFGNFGQAEDGVDNKLPHPDVRQLYSDDTRIIVGQDESSGRRRVELRDAVETKDATIRELQTWSSWKAGSTPDSDATITVPLNVGGLPPGDHAMQLVVIDGVDAEGWDHVVFSLPITVAGTP